LLEGHFEFPNLAPGELCDVYRYVMEFE
jgi:hypothetical protein